MTRYHYLWFLPVSWLFAATVCWATPPLKIGVVSGLSGIASKWNHYQNNGARLAQEEFVAQGVPVELIFEDSQTIGSKAVSAFNKLLDADKVDAVMADDFGFAVAPLIPLAGKRQKLLVTISNPQDRYCEQGQGYFYTLSSQFLNMTEAWERFFRVHPEIKRAAMFVFDDPEWGHSYQKMWSALASKYGIEITDTFVTSEPTPDFRSMVTRALAKKPDLLMLAHEPITFSKAVAATRFSGPILSANNFLEVLHQQEDVGRIAQQVIIADPVISQEFRRSYEERFKEPPILEAYSGYEAIRTTVKALQRNREHPELAMKELKYQGVGGEVDFTGTSCAGNKTGWGLFRIKGRSTVPWD